MNINDTVIDSKQPAETWLREVFTVLRYGPGRIEVIIKALKNFEPLPKRIFIKRRQLNEMFDISSDLRLIKRSNDQTVPDDEPIFIFRARDYLSRKGIASYIEEMVADGADGERIESVRAAYLRFEAFAEKYPDRMKQPGITKGA